MGEQRMRTAMLFALAGVAQAATVPYTLDLRGWIVDYQRPTIEPRVAPYKIAMGAKMRALLANNTFPGPEVRAKEGDTIEVTVINNCLADGVSLTWTGVEVQSSPPHVISAQGGIGTYKLLASKAGTFRWYASLPVQAVQGLHGALTIENATVNEATEERMVVLSDARQRAEVCFDQKGQWDDKSCGNLAKATLNGQWGDGSKDSPVPVIEVKEGECYLIRILGFSEQQGNTFAFSVKDHTFAVNGATNVPIVKVVPNTDEGVDATLCANQKPGVFGSKDFPITYQYSKAFGD